MRPPVSQERVAAPLAQVGGVDAARLQERP
jgi:hypothetical protein